MRLLIIGRLNGELITASKIALGSEVVDTDESGVPGRAPGGTHRQAQKDCQNGDGECRALPT